MLEACVLIADTSEWQRNADFSPSRMQAQHDCINLLSNHKSMSNVESEVALIAAGGRPVVLQTLTQEVASILSALHGVKLGGDLAFVQSLLVGQLLLANRKNTNQHQRMVVFVGSPLVNVTEDELEMTGAQLRKNGIGVDVVCYGGMGEEHGAAGTESAAKQESLLKAFMAGCDAGGNCRLLTVPPGTGGHLSDLVRSSPIMRDWDDDAPDAGAGAGAGGSGGGGGAGGGDDLTDAERFAEWGGIDPSVDPELAQAMKASLMAAQADAGGADGGDDGAAADGGDDAPAAATTGGDAAMSDAAPTTPAAGGGAVLGDDDDDLYADSDDDVDDGDDDDDDEAALLEQAMLLSMQQAAGGGDAGGNDGDGDDGGDDDDDDDDGDDDDDDDEEALALALAMSMAESKKPDDK